MVRRPRANRTAIVAADEIMDGRHVCGEIWMIPRLSVEMTNNESAFCWLAK